MCLNCLKTNQGHYYNLHNSAFWGWLSMESQPQNPELRINFENFHLCIQKAVAPYSFVSFQGWGSLCPLPLDLCTPRTNENWPFSTWDFCIAFDAGVAIWMQAKMQDQNSDLKSVNSSAWACKGVLCAAALCIHVTKENLPQEWLFFSISYQVFCVFQRIASLITTKHALFSGMSQNKCIAWMCYDTLICLYGMSFLKCNFLSLIKNSFLCNKIIMLKYVKQSYVNRLPHRETPLTLFQSGQTQITSSCKSCLSDQGLLCLIMKTWLKYDPTIEDVTSNLFWSMYKHEILLFPQLWKSWRGILK